MISTVHFRPISLVLLIGALATPVAAQTAPNHESATLQGTVCNAHHQPLPGVEVSLQSSDGSEIGKTRTNQKGAFTFPDLHAGTYMVHSVIAGYGEGKIRGITLAAHAQKSVVLIVAAPTLAFFDEPSFSVAGVTDTTNLGGHGSDVVVRTRTALTKDTLVLGGNAPASSKVQAGTETGLRAAQMQEPGSFAANYRLAEFFVDSNRADDAKPYLDRAAAAELSDSALRPPDKGSLHHLLGRVAEQRRDPLAAAREYQRAAEIDPSEANIFDWGAELLLHQAPEPATDIFSKGHQLYPSSLRMLVGQGAAWYVRGSYELAAQRLCEAADIDPRSPIPYSFLLKMIETESNESSAIAERFQRFATLEPNNAHANYYYAVSLWKQRAPEDPETAARVKALLEKAVLLDPKFADAYLQLGIVHAERKDYGQAVVAYRRAIELDPRMEVAHFRLAQAYRLSGQSEKAADEVKLYEELSNKRSAESDRERSEVKRFVYTLREENRAPQE